MGIYVGEIWGRYRGDVGRYGGDDLLELLEVDTLVEVNVVELDHAVAALAHARDGEVVVEGEVQLGLTWRG